MCISLYDALQSIENNTIVKITLLTVLLEDAAYIEVEYLNNVTITGNNVVVMCNNKGGMYWGSVDNIVIEGITWDQCGNPRYPNVPAIYFRKVFQISISKCTFQHFKVCQAISLSSAEEENISVHVENSSFMFNKVENASVCFGNQGSILIRDNDDIRTKNAEIIISGSVFYSNGNCQPKHENILVGVLFCFLYSPLTLKILIHHSNFSSNGILGMYINDNANSSYIAFNNVTIFNNSQGGVEIVLHSNYAVLDIISSSFIQNNNGTLVLDMISKNVLNFKATSFVRNIGTYNSQGSAIYIQASINATINLHHCDFEGNIALGGYSILYISSEAALFTLGLNVAVLLDSSRFVNNLIGSALHASHVMVIFHNFVLFQSNLAEAGAVIYVDQNSLITVTDKSSVQFVNNSASLRGGTIYSDLSDCFDKGVLFSNISNLSSFIFINNTATISGNSLYFNIPISCNVERNYAKNYSVAYIPYKLKYIQSHNTIGSTIATSPYGINLCLPHNCSFTNDNCLLTEKKMLGQFVYFNATVSGYFNASAESVQFQIKCINCDTKYRLLENELLVNNRSPNKIQIIAIDAHNDVVNDTNITLELSSVLSEDHKELSARLYIKLSTCYNGFLFSTNSQKCECHKSSSINVVVCQEDHVEIKLGYWYGIIYAKHTASPCPIHYCDFNYRTETRRNYYILPKAIDDQCSSHRTGVVCSDCKSGYTLAYDSFNCVNVNQCTPGMTVLVIGLTFLYWILITIFILALKYHQGISMELFISTAF